MRRRRERKIGAECLCTVVEPVLVLWVELEDWEKEGAKTETFAKRNSGQYLQSKWNLILISSVLEIL